MKKWALLILLILGLSWMTSLAEGFLCDADGHEAHAQMHEGASPEKDALACHVEFCHFGHCAHIHARLASALLREPESHAGPHAPPYAFIPSHAPVFSLMRPPLVFG